MADRKQNLAAPPPAGRTGQVLTGRVLTGQVLIGRVLTGRVLPVAAIAVLVGLAVAFWSANGARVFAEMALSAWNFCF